MPNISERIGDTYWCNPCSSEGEDHYHKLKILSSEEAWMETDGEEDLLELTTREYRQYLERKTFIKVVK